MQPQSPYTFNQVGNNVEVLQNGQRISTGTASAAERYGYVANPVGVAKTLNPDTTAPTVQSTTPTTLSGDKSQQIADNTRKVQDLTVSNQPTQQLTGGIEYYSDGTPISAPSDAIIQRDESGNTWWSAGGKNYAIGPDQGLSAEEKQKKDLLEQVKNQTDSAFARQISAVQAQYDSLIKQQKDVSLRQEASVGQSLLMGGTSRYAGLNAAGIDTAQISYGIQQIADLQAKQNMAIAQIQSAQADKDYEFVSKELQRLDDIKKEKQKVAKDLNDKLLEANKALRQQTETRNNAIDNDIRTAILYAQKGGATPEQLAAMRDALANHDYASAIAAGGNSIVTAPGWMGEYMAYKKDAEARGQVAMDPVAFKNWDDNNKISIAKAGVAGASGYSTQTLTKVQQIAGQFDNEQSVKNYQVVSEGKSFLDSIPNNTKNPADQQGVIYAFAKIMDPNSVVREGEYNTVQKYAQSWADTFGFNAKRIFSNSPFLSEEAIKNMKATIASKVKASESSYKNIYDEYGRRINKVSGGKDGSEFITDYSKGYTSTSSNLIQLEEQKAQKIESALTTLKTSNPKLYTTASKMYTSVNPSTGAPYTSDEILQAFPELNK